MDPHPGPRPGGVRGADGAGADRYLVAAPLADPGPLAAPRDAVAGARDPGRRHGHPAGRPPDGHRPRPLRRRRLDRDRGPGGLDLPADGGDPRHPQPGAGGAGHRHRRPGRFAGATDLAPPALGGGAGVLLDVRPRRAGGERQPTGSGGSTPPPGPRWRWPRSAGGWRGTPPPTGCRWSGDRAAHRPPVRPRGAGPTRRRRPRGGRVPTAGRSRRGCRVVGRPGGPAGSAAPAVPPGHAPRTGGPERAAGSGRRRLPDDGQARDGPAGARPGAGDRQRRRERAGQPEGPCPGTRRPHLLLDGAATLAALVGSPEVVVHTHRSGRGTALLQALDRALEERRAAGVADPAWRLSAGPDGYVSGEASAVASFVAGGEARPRFSGNRMASGGPSGRPTVVCNAETVAHLGYLAHVGGRGRWAPDSPDGPRLVTLAGAVDGPGEVVEAGGGATLGDILARAGWSAPPAAVLVGGYAGTWVDGPTAWWTPFDRPGLERVGCRPGCGLVAVLPPGPAGWRRRRDLTRYLAGESAGQCGPCVLGLPGVADGARGPGGRDGSGGGASAAWRRGRLGGRAGGLRPSRRGGPPGRLRPAGVRRRRRPAPGRRRLRGRRSGGRSWPSPPAGRPR